jgi:hypothetical protein
MSDVPLLKKVIWMCYDCEHYDFDFSKGKCPECKSEHVQGFYERSDIIKSIKEFSGYLKTGYSHMTEIEEKFVELFGDVERIK